MTEVANMERLAEVWRKMQDRIEALRAECEKAVHAIEVQQDQVSAALLAEMNKMNGDSLKTKAGIIERKQEYKPSASDWAAVYRFVRENDAWEMLHKRLSSTYIQKYAEAHTTVAEDGTKTVALPPGISVYTGFKINVKKPKVSKPQELENA